MTTVKGVTRLRPDLCPLCGKVLDAAGSSDGADVAPGPGDWTVCAGCFQWLVYGPFMDLRAVTDAEWAALPHDERIGLTIHQLKLRAVWGKR